LKAVVREIGQRPAIATPARLNAPQGAMALADLFAPHDFADLVVINIDWQGDGFTPALYIDAAKWHPDWPGQPVINNPYVIDLEDAFGGDKMDNSTLREIVEGFRVAFTQAYEIRKQGEASGSWHDRRQTTYDI
jgi:hypothetical protein